MPPSSHSLHIALNKVNPDHYKNLRPLRGAVNDAILMEALARETWGMHTTKHLYDEDATTENVLGALQELAGQLRAGDLLLITYSGHGGLVPDPYWNRRGKDEENDQTWCLYDRQLLDDEIFEALSRFKQGVRIVVTSDSCHSGTVTRVEEEAGPDDAALLRQGFVPKELDKDMVGSIYEAFYALYDGISSRFRDQSYQPEPAARVLLFAACQDDQCAYDGPRHGRFTLALKDVLDQPGAIRCNAEQIFSRLKQIYTYPTPNLFVYGAPNPDFDEAFPFSLNPAAVTVALPEPEIKTTEIPVATAAIPAPVSAAAAVKPSAFFLSVRFVPEQNNEENLRRIFPQGLKSYLRAATSNTFIAEIDAASCDSEWSAILQAFAKADALDLSAEIEPARSRGCDVVFYPEGAKAVGKDAGWLEMWPPIKNKAGLTTGWHLGDDYSQLASARDRVWARLNEGQVLPVRIAHIDTGYDRYHPAFRQLSHVQHDLARSFLLYEQIPGRTGALDVYYGDGEIQGHGLGTLAQLAGGRVLKEHTQGDFEGIIGYVPFAHVIPMRISETVVIMDATNFCAAVEYAIEQKCEVITMSMAGKPSGNMAKVINKAYEHGITIVTAAGNSWTEGIRCITPKTVLYPARFPRVIAACGVCQNQKPYDFEAQELYAEKGDSGIEVMQGNWGPAQAMGYALAAYTPNLPWADGEKDMKGHYLHIFKKGGGGTSSATPQIAAAAALWIMEHRAELDQKGYSGTWKQVEAVRQALFGSADKTTFGDWKKYYGNGILKALRALDTPCPDISDSMKAPESESTWWGLSELADLLLQRRRSGMNMKNMRTALAMELQHVLFSDPNLFKLAESLDFSKSFDAHVREELEAALRHSPYASEELKMLL